MSAISTVLCTCPDLQGRLEDVWQWCQQPGSDDRIPFLEWLNTPENRAGITQQIVPGQGKIRNFEVTYFQRLPESSVVANQPNPNCGVGEDPGNLCTTYSLDTDVNLQTQGTSLTAQQVEEYCGDNARLWDLLLLRQIDALDRRVATQAAVQAVALTGGWSDDVPTGTDPGEINGSGQIVVQTLLSSGDVDRHAWPKLRNALDDSGFCSQVALFGGGVMREFWQLYQAGCCAAEGLDLGRLMELYGYAYMHDKRVKAALGDDAEFLIVSPGALQMLNYTRSPWKEGLPAYVQDGANYVHTVIQSPRTGLPFDMTVQDVCGTITINLTYTGKLIGLPTDMFATGDVYEGITYVAQGIVDNP